jgi:hypothetical protein
MAKNLQNVEYKQGHIDWSFEKGPWFEPGGAVAEGEAAQRGLKSSFWFIGDDEDGPMVVFIDIPPNTTGRLTPAHSHASDQVRIIVSGDFKIGNDWYRAGDVRFQEAGKIYGPEMTGPEGSRQILVFSNRSGVVADYLGQEREPAAAGLLQLIAKMSKASAA